MPFCRISEYNANRLLELEFEDGVFISYHSDDPGEDGSNEIPDSVRTFVSNWSIAAGKALHNGNDIESAAFPADCSVNHFGAWDAAEGGNFLRGVPRLVGSPPEVTAIAVIAGDTVRIPAGDCEFSFENVEV